MFKTVLVCVTGSKGDAATLDTAYLFGRLFHSHITCLHVKPGPAQLIAQLATGDIAADSNNGELLTALVEESDRRSNKAHLAFTEFCARWGIPAKLRAAGHENVSAAWQQIEGNIVETIVAEARFHDITVLGRAPLAGLTTDGIGAILVGSGRPLILAAARAPENLGAAVAIAWKNTAESARALAVADSLLARTQKAMLLTAGEESGDPEADAKSRRRIAEHLQRKGVDVAAHHLVPAQRSLPDTVLEAAAALGIDLLIMGGYGHSRMREFIFGGFTRHVLKESPIPIFIFH